MNRMVLWLINAVLFLLACAVTAWVVGLSPAGVSGDAKSEAKSGRAERKSDHKGVAREVDEPDVRQGTASIEDADTLWQQTLFRPERTEDVTQAPVEEAVAGAVAVDLELVGLARIGERAVAVIVQYRGQARRPTTSVPAGSAPGMARRSMGARSAAAPPAATPGADADAEATPDRHVYKVGDKIGESGYTLKEIRLKEKEVVLVRGSEERILKLDATDDQSSSRRETAAALAATASAKSAVEAPPPGAAKPPGGASAAAPPLPPPPVAAAVGAQAPIVPGQVVPGGNGATGGPMSREERLERARLLRERILQGRPPTNTTN